MFTCITAIHGMRCCLWTGTVGSCLCCRLSLRFPMAVAANRTTHMLRKITWSSDWGDASRVLETFGQMHDLRFFGIFAVFQAFASADQVREEKLFEQLNTFLKEESNSNVHVLGTRPFMLLSLLFQGFLGGSDGTESACNVGDVGLIPGLGRSLKKEMATYSSILAWDIPWTEEPGGL